MVYFKYVIPHYISPLIFGSYSMKYFFINPMQLLAIFLTMNGGADLHSLSNVDIMKSSVGYILLLLIFLIYLLF